MDKCDRGCSCIFVSADVHTHPLQQPAPELIYASATLRHRGKDLADFAPRQLAPRLGIWECAPIGSCDNITKKFYPQKYILPATTKSHLLNSNLVFFFFTLNSSWNLFKPTCYAYISHLWRLNIFCSMWLPHVQCKCTYCWQIYHPKEKLGSVRRDACECCGNWRPFAPEFLGFSDDLWGPSCIFHNWIMFLTSDSKRKITKYPDMPIQLQEDIWQVTVSVKCQ